MSGTEPLSTELTGMPTLDLVEQNFKTYFYVTKKGKDLHFFDETWQPFDDDDDDEPKPNWHLD